MEIWSWAPASCVTLCFSSHLSGLGCKSPTMLRTSRSHQGKAMIFALYWTQGKHAGAVGATLCKGVFEKGHGMISGWRLATLVYFWPIRHIPSSTGLALSRPAPGFLFNPCPSQDSICHHTFVSVPSPIAVFLITSDLPECQ